MSWIDNANGIVSRMKRKRNSKWHCQICTRQRDIYFLVNIFVRHTFPMSKSSTKTKTVLTMTDMTQSTELRAFLRQKDGYKVTVKISLCICFVLS